MNALLVKLHEMRAAGITANTSGLDDASLESLVQSHPELAEVIDAAYAAFLALRSSRPDLLKLDEREQMHAVQADYVNFYPDDGVNPYGPTAHGRSTQARDRTHPRRLTVLPVPVP